LQRTVEITCTGVSLTGVITGHLYIGSGQQRSDFGLELICAGLATVDQRKIEQGFAPKSLLDAQNQAAANRVGLWSIESNRENEVSSVFYFPIYFFTFIHQHRHVHIFQSLSRPTSKVTERVLNINITEIRNSSTFFFRVSDDDSGNVIDKSMKHFSSNYGIKGAPCDAKVNKIVAALFDDGTGNSWYRAKILEIKSAVATVLFIDWGNSAKVDVSTQLRRLDFELGVDRIPPAAKEAIMALTKARDLDDDDGVAAARYLRSLCWGKIVKAQIFCEQEAKAVIALYEPNNNNATSINEELISDGLARISKAGELKILSNKIIDTKNLESLFNSLSLAQENARKSRRGIWRYGDIGDDDDDAI
jgi:staphylococcal nuclease domain-containing protein 1